MQKKRVRSTRVLLALLAALCVGQVFPQAPVQADSTPLTAEDRALFIGKVSSLLNHSYVFPEVAAQIEKHLKMKLAAGAFD